jgi:hypothetical protein
MMKNSIEQLEQNLFLESDGSKFSRLKDKLLKTYGDAEREKVINIFTDYAKRGEIIHWRAFLMTDIIELVHENEAQYVEFFEWTITIPELAYWGIDGLLKTNGKEAYNKIIALINKENLSLEVRGKAIKSISKYSKQAFDRALPEDPGYWNLDDLRLSEILKWQQNGYADGIGYSEPKLHPSLKNPKSTLEKVISKLDKKLKVIRSKNQDLSNPSNWLAIANDSDILNIEKKWTLPENYLLFLKNFSPILVFISGEKYFQDLKLYGANDLIEAQNGYSFNTATQEAITDWPDNFIVIADSGSDPYCIDIGNIKNNDSPIYTSIHGTGKWEFELYTDSFIEFLKELAEN